MGGPIANSEILRSGTCSLPMWSYDHFALPLPERHRYPRGRLRLTRERVIADGLATGTSITFAQPLDWEELERIHTAEYLGRLRTGRLPREQVLELGLPFSIDLVTRARAACFGTLHAARAALQTGAAAIIGGGHHHGFADRPAGYCLFNDLAVAIASVRADRLAHRVAIIDLDVHQGNGSAAIFARDPDVFTFSVHAASNWPPSKAQSDLDIALPDETGDAEYLAVLDRPLAAILEQFRPDLVLYQAGVDPLHSDRLGRLALTHAGLKSRDARVLGACHRLGIPVVVTLGGGYAQPIADSVEAHVNTVRVMTELWVAPSEGKRVDALGWPTRRILS
jgi:acetoin utilization deacetylase AcuC-like enzyme